MSDTLQMLLLEFGDSSTDAGQPPAKEPHQPRPRLALPRRGRRRRHRRRLGRRRLQRRRRHPACPVRVQPQPPEPHLKVCGAAADEVEGALAAAAAALPVDHREGEGVVIWQREARKDGGALAGLDAHDVGQAHGAELVLLGRAVGRRGWWVDGRGSGGG